MRRIRASRYDVRPMSTGQTIGRRAAVFMSMRFSSHHAANPAWVPECRAVWYPVNHASYSMLIGAREALPPIHSQIWLPLSHHISPIGEVLGVTVAAGQCDCYRNPMSAPRSPREEGVFSEDHSMGSHWVLMELLPGERRRDRPATFRGG